MKLYTQMNVYCPCPGTCEAERKWSSQGCKRIRRDLSDSREIKDGNMELSMSVVHLMGKDYDKVEFKLRKRGIFVSS